MLKVTIPSIELFDEKTSRFFKTKEVTLVMEHSLVSISKWESNWRKAFLTKEKKTREQTLDYIRCMTITQNIDPNVYNFIPDAVMEEIISYIESPRTATIIKDVPGGINREIITSEIIYYWMITFNIPLECQTWHLDRLLTLIKVMNIKNQPKKKLSRSEINARNTALNEKRKLEMKTSG